MKVRKPPIRERVLEDPNAVILIPSADYIDAVRRTLGIIDIDLCSSSIAQKSIEAQAWYPADRAEAALADPWHGRAFLRPHPNSNIARYQLQKILRDYLADRITAAVLLLNKTDWLRQEPLLQSFPFLLHYKRMPHYRWLPDKQIIERFNPSFHSTTVYLPQKDGAYFDEEKLGIFIDHFSPFGRIIISEGDDEDWQQDAARAHIRAPIKPVLTAPLVDRYGQGNAE